MNQRCTSALLSVTMICGLFVTVRHVAAEDSYTIDAKIMAVRADDLNHVAVKGERAEVRSSSGSAQAGSIAFGALSDLQIGSWAVTFDENGGLLWNGKPGPPAAAKVDLITEPRLRVVAGEKALILVSSRLQFFEATDDGLYALRTSEEQDAPGVELGCTATPDEDDRLVLDIDLKVVLMERRETIPGVKLDVGRPVLLTHQVSSRLSIAQDQWALVSAQQVESASGDGGHFLLCLLRVRK